MSTALPAAAARAAAVSTAFAVGHEGVMLLGPKSGSSQTAGHSPLLIPCIACRGMNRDAAASKRVASVSNVRRASGSCGRHAVAPSPAPL